MKRELVRWRRRGWLVLNNALNLVIVPALNVLLSVLVVRLYSAELWGALIGWFLLVQLGVHFVAWGNKDYLVRRFSQNPARIAAAWQTSWLTRATLLLPTGVWLVLSSDSSIRAVLLILWCVLLAFDQAFEAPVVYYKEFGWAAAIDFFGLLFQIGMVLVLGTRLDLDALILILLLATLLKAIALSARFGRALLSQGWMGRLDWGELRASFPLFLLTLSGLLASRIDAYAVNALLPRASVAQYQIYLNFLLILQTGAAVLLLPFVKNLYRLGALAFLNQVLRFTGLGLLVTIPGIISIYFLIPLLYHWTLTLQQLALGFLIVLPPFFYIPIVYALYQQKRESVVVLYSFAAAAISLTLSIWLLPQLGLVGGLVGNASGQIVIGIAYWFTARRISSATPTSKVELMNG
jgi:O-antigen/teichoic acid export membrane protein